MKFIELQILLDLLRNNYEVYTIEKMFVYCDYVDVYFNSSNYEALEFFELYWDKCCEMHSSNDSYVRFIL